MLDVTDIPPELWLKITTTACTDGGFTGTSLALTNRFFHAQSLSTRFHSLAFTSLARVEAFLAFLDAQPEACCRPLIEHLFLSFVQEPAPAKPTPDFWDAVYFKLSWEEQQTYRDDVSAQKDAWNRRFVPALTRLLALAGPHLRTLCVAEDAFLPFDAFPVVDALPRLEELTLGGGCAAFISEKLKLPWASLLDPHTPMTPFDYPSLQRLHYVENGAHGPAPSNLLATLVKHAPPALTHLRFSDLNSSHQTFAVQLAICLGVDQTENRWRVSDEDHPPPGAADRLSKVHHVVLHGLPPAPGGKCGNPYISWGRFCDLSQAIARAVRDTRGIEVVHMDRDWRPEVWERRWPDRLYADWLDRIEGGNGCWVTSEEEEIQLENRLETRRSTQPISVGLKGQQSKS